MVPIRQAAESEVWEHWRRVENHRTPDFRSDIRQKLPETLTWYLSRVEPQDVARLFIISSDDWTDVSAGTFRITSVVSRVESQSSNQDTRRITADIQEKRAHLDSGGHLDARLISITDSPSLFGPFTLIEGNRRAVAFQLRGSLVGSDMFVGVSSKVVHCVWARHTYGDFLRGFSAMDR
jgi:hypothetical protein